MIKRKWLALCPIAMLLGFGFAQSILAASQSDSSTECTNCQAKNDAPTDDSDYGNDNFDNSQDLSQDQPDSSSAQKPAQEQTSNSPINL